tara:strand:+ start:4946 stop:8104 length:3159 start_codon:yes stop_codon:yes gene_type:complete
VTSINQQKTYPEVPQQADYPNLEKEVLRTWKQTEAFERSISKRPAGHEGSNEFVFYDGPPFANGLPHFGHLLTGYVKDIIPRYQTLRGKRVERRFGWDCHGLPAEMEAERELQVSGRAAIRKFGIDRFNNHCKETVLRYTAEWEKYVTRQARWVDFKNDYKTMDTPYIESVMWAFKTLYDKNLLYEGYRVLPYSWACETPVSNFETRLDDSYRERQDPAVTVRFTLEERIEGRLVDILAWTTTPWTLPSNLALAVGPDIEYGIYELGDRLVVIGKACIEKYAKELASAQLVGTRSGSELVGAPYEPLFDFFQGRENCHRILSADWIDTEEGTGIVHMAPGFGEDDMNTCSDAKIEVVCPVDDHGRFTGEVPNWEGLQVFEANTPIIRSLRQEERIFREESYVHNYPHCWRTDTPLIYRAVNSWYVRVTQFRDRMAELNQEINWIPGHIKDGLFGNWLSNARDWSISRNRFWGSPIPVWKSDNPQYPRIDVYGSLAEIEKDFGVRPRDLHRPIIDELIRPNPDDPTGQSTMRRIPDVLDGWFDSGSMPFAQVHYPFENREWFEQHSPADFIVEYVAQTRGWFYTLMVLGTALFDRPPFKNCMCHGVTLAEDGQKLSKRLKNYPDPEEVFDTYGSDALRWHLVSSPLLKGGDLKVDKDGKAIGDVVRNVLNPLWNSWYFFSLYANSDGVQANWMSSPSSLLDRYILAKTREVVLELTKLMDSYEIASACNRIVTFMDAVNNWYIRRSRERFWKSEKDSDKQDAYDTLHTVLVTLCRIASPLLPYLTENIYSGLTGGDSVHISDWPDPNTLINDPGLVRHMDRVREICSASLSLRRSHDIRVRQPLKELTVAGKGIEHLSEYSDLIKDEVNVKTVSFQSDISEFANFKLKLNSKILGPRLGKNMKSVLAAAKSGQWENLDENKIRVNSTELNENEYQLLLEPVLGVDCQALPGNEMVVALNMDVDDELLCEGFARDIVRVVQQARKEESFNVSDRIKLAISIPTEWSKVENFLSWIAEQTLASEIQLVADMEDEEGNLHRSEVGGEVIQVRLQQI